MILSALPCYFALIHILLGAAFANKLQGSSLPRKNLRSNEMALSESKVFFSDTHQNTTAETAFRQTRRRTQQGRTILIIRVVNNGKGPSVNANVVRQYVFTDPNSLKAQMMRCSSNAIVFNPAPYGEGGVVDVPVQTSQSARSLINAAATQTPRRIGVTDLRKAADHVMFILPKINNYFAEAEVGSGFSYYNDEYGVALSVLMHEIGHNLGKNESFERIRTDDCSGLGHAGVRSDEYADYSGNMGRSIVRRGGPLLCFNAANHWDLGWFTRGRRDLGTSAPSNPIKITLTGFSSHPSGNTFLVKLGNIYMQYNHAFAHNIDTDSSTANKLVVVQKGDKARTSRLAVLGEGGEYRSAAFVVRVCANNGASIDMSIGKSGANCEAAASSPAQPVSRPEPMPTNSWGNNWSQPAPRPAPTGTVSTWWKPAPTPQFFQPTFTFPSPTVIWFPQAPAPVVTVSNPRSPTPDWLSAPAPQPIGNAWSSWTWSSIIKTGPSWPWTCFFGC